MSHENDIEKDLKSGRIRSKKGILTASNDAIKSAFYRLKKEASAWVDEYVPKKTGFLISTFNIDPTVDEASLQNQFVKLKVKLQFTAEYAKHVDEMWRRSYKPRDAHRKAPFVRPLIEFLNARLPALIAEEMASHGLSFNRRSMKIGA